MSDIIPSVRERVLIEGREGLFLVVAIDLQRKVADLVPVHGRPDLEEDVPLSLLRHLADLSSRFPN